MKALGRTASSRFRELAPWILDVCLPPACAGCHEHLPTPSGTPPGQGPRICPRCRARLKPPAHPRCVRCHAPRGTGIAEDRPCTECHDWPPSLVGARAAVVLAPPADALVHGLKYGGWHELAGEMAEMMARTARGEWPCLKGRPVVAVPTTPGRLRTRGYNQARELAVGVARELRGRHVEALLRTEDGGSQVALHRSERRANVHKVFSPNGEAIAEIRGREPILVDDVLTTGATGCAAAEVLVEAGARGVFLLTFARTLPGSL